MDKQKLAAIGERLKTGGAEMGRKVSGKMKEILQVQSQEAKMIDEATSESLEEPDWGMNLRICNLINREEFNGSEVVRAIKKKLTGKSEVSQRLSLDLLETCAMNCEKVFSEIASEKVLDEIVRLIDNPQAHRDNKARAFQLIEAWGKSNDLDYLPVFKQTYKSLKARQASLDTRNLPTERGNVEDVSLLQSPYHDTYNQDFDPDLLAYQGGHASEEEKKEILVAARNGVEILSSVLSIDTEQKSILKDELTLNLLEKCKESQQMVQRIIETTGDDEVKMIEALSIHDDLQNVLARYEALEAADQTPKVQDSKDSGRLHEAETGPSAQAAEEQQKFMVGGKDEVAVVVDGKDIQK